MFFSWVLLPIKIWSSCFWTCWKIPIFYLSSLYEEDIISYVDFAVEESIYMATSTEPTAKNINIMAQASVLSFQEANLKNRQLDKKQDESTFSM